MRSFILAISYRTVVFIVGISFFATSKSIAQYENVWAFGEFAGIDFNSALPKALKTSMKTSEGCASICDSTGKLLFYTDGTYVWDHNHNLMPNGNDLPGLGINITSSTEQGALIIPMPGDKQKYYVFSLGAKEILPPRYRGSLYYSLIDMSLNNGLGDIISDKKGIFLDSNLVEFMTAVTGDNCNIWLLVGSGSSPLKAYNIDFQGIDPYPVVSTTIAQPVNNGPDFGYISVSPDRSKIAIRRDFDPPVTILCDFDPVSGMASRPILLPTAPYATCFSLDNSKLYASGGGLFQFDLSSNDSATIVNSMIAISGGIPLGYYGMNRGPDGKIYCVSGDNYLNVINKPNLLGSACEYVVRGFPLLPGTYSNFGLTNVAAIVTNRQFYTSQTDTALCLRDTILLTAKNVISDIEYVWENGSTGPTRSIDRSGIYWVRYQINSSCILDDYVDTFIVTYPEKEYKVSFIIDTFICENDLVVFKNTSDVNFNSFNWIFGDQDSSILRNPEHIYVQPGNYEVRLIGNINGACPDTAYQSIVVDPRIFSSFSAYLDSVCVGELIAFSHSMESKTIININWNWGDGLELFSYENKVQHAYDVAGIIPVTLSVQFRACPDTFFTDTVYVFALPHIDLGHNTSICENGSSLILSNKILNSNENYKYLWNTGDTTETLRVAQPGIYSLTVNAEPLGCSTTESIEIMKNCYIDIPNVFTPNEDGINDYFIPRQLLSSKVTNFRLQIFNRWGQLVFETTKSDGKGWDGKLNGKHLPEDVYVYLLDVEIGGKKQESYKGNITLIR